MRKNPGAQDQEKKNHSAGAANQRVRAANHVLARTARCEKKTKEISVEIDENKESAEQIFGLLESFQPGLGSVQERLPQKKKKGVAHGVKSAALPSPE